MFLLTVLNKIVLIDTWWNVNCNGRSTCGVGDSVLIDTWWNVNGIIVRINSGGGDGFNRYMVECE